MHDHDVAGESAVYYTHHEGASFIAKHLREETPQISQMCNVIFRICLATYDPHL